MSSTLSRRDFGKVAGVGIAAAAVTIAAGPKTMDSFSPENASLDERLKEYELEQFVGIHKQSQEMTNFFGGSPWLWASITDTLENASQRRIDVKDQSVLNLTEGWFTKSKQAEVDALRHIDNDIKIDTTGSKETTEGEMQNFLKDMSNPCPVLSLALPSKVVVWNGGGAYYYGNDIALASPHDRVISPVVFLRETTKVADFQWSKLKPYIFQNDMIQYIATHLKATSKIAHDWIENKNPLNYANNLPLLNMINDSQNISHYKNLMDQMNYMGSVCNVSAEDLNKLPTDIPHSVVVNRWNTLVHAVGQQLKQLPDYQRADYINPRREILYKLFVSGINSIKDDKGRYSQLPGLFDEIGEHLNGPVQKTSGGLPSSEDEIGKSLIAREVAEVQKKRLLAYTTFSASTSLKTIKSVLEN